MNVPDQTEQDIARIALETQTIAVVGLSPRPERASHEVADFLQRSGYRIIPVNPGHAGETILGEKVYADLASIPVPVDMVDVFRRSDAVAGIVEDIIAHMPDLKFLWTQLGVRDDEAASKAREAGITVVQDRCPKIEFPRLL